MERYKTDTELKAKVSQYEKFDCIIWRRSNECNNSQTVLRRWVVNLSSREFEEEELAVLSRGLSSAIATWFLICWQLKKKGYKHTKIPQTEVETAVVGFLRKSRLPPSNKTPSESRALKDMFQHLIQDNPQLK